jgi:hypothetical protein
MLCSWFPIENNLTLRSGQNPQEIEDAAELVAKTLGNSQRGLVVGATFIDDYGRPENPSELPKFDTVACTDDTFDCERDGT